jgi:hypothetical protein
MIKVSEVFKIAENASGKFLLEKPKIIFSNAHG